MARALVAQADARHLPLPDASVDLIVTSPPYWGQRSYEDDGQPLAGQIGAEVTPAEWLAAMMDCTAEWVRVLKPSGSIFVNLGDSFSAYNNNRGPSRSLSAAADRGRNQVSQPGLPAGTRAKSLMGLPWRYAIRCMDDLGLILRRDNIWSKSSALPESVTDRCATRHEYIFHLVKQPRYYSAVDEIRESAGDYQGKTWDERKIAGEPGRNRGGGANDVLTSLSSLASNPLGALPGSVWEFASEPLSLPDWLGVKHYAAFPTALPRKAILGWSPSGICTVCGEGRRPVSVGERVNGNHGPVAGAAWGSRKTDTATGHRNEFQTIRAITGYACACPDATAPTHPALVVDPFGGTGTTALVAVAHGRHGLSFDRSGGYSRAARWRTRDSSERAKARGEAKPPPAKRERHDLYGGLTDELDALLEESL